MLAPYLYIETACLLTALIFLRHAPRPWPLLRPYLALVVAAEAIGGWLAHGGIANHHVHNALLLVEGIFIPSFLYALIRPYGRKRSEKLVGFIWRGWLAAFVILYPVELVWVNHGAVFNRISYVALALVTVVGSLYYLVRVALAPPATPLWRHGPFWWVNGTLQFFIGTLLIQLILPALVREPVNVWGFPLHFVVINANIVILYGLWSYSFVCVSRRLKSSGR